MSSFFEDICPLCSRARLPEQLYAHIAREHERVRAKTIQVIQAYHQGWTVDDGACEPCWKSYRDAGRVLDRLQRMRPGQPEPAWLTSDWPRGTHGGIPGVLPPYHRARHRRTW